MARHKPLIERQELWFLFIAVIWTLLWNLLFMRLFMDWLNTHPMTPPPIAYIVHQAGYLIMFYLLSLVLFRKPAHVSRFAIGSWLLFTAFEVAIPPLCISQQGNILVEAGNQSCLAGNDTFFSWLFNLIGVQYGHPLMFYLVYIVGMLSLFIAAVLVLNKKELWSALGKGG